MRAHWVTSSTACTRSLTGWTSPAVRRAGPDDPGPARIGVTVTVAGGAVTFDFSDTDDQRPGAVNAVEAVTVSAVALRDPLGHRPHDPRTAGAAAGARDRPARFHRRSRPPVAVGAGNVEVSQRVADVCLGALASAAPDRVGAASQGTMNNVLVGGSTWVYYETVGGGQGGRPGPRPGMSGVHGDDEHAGHPGRGVRAGVPRCASTGTASGTGAAAPARAQRRGLVRELEISRTSPFSLVTERRSVSAVGPPRRGAGRSGERLLPGGDETRAERLPDKCTRRLVRATCCMYTPAVGDGERRLASGSLSFVGSAARTGQGRSDNGKAEGQPAPVLLMLCTSVVLAKPGCDACRSGRGARPTLEVSPSRRSPIARS